MKIQPWEQMTERDENRIVAILTLLAIVVFLTVTARCETLPDAPSVTHKAAPTINRQLWTAIAVHGAVRVVDDVHTCQNLAGGGREYIFPTQSCGGVVAINSLVYASTVFASYELAKHGHRKLAVALQYIGAASDSAFILFPFKSVGPANTERLPQ